jgi:membrane-bound ClpP family serine protease
LKHKQLLDELRVRGSSHDIVRREYLEKLHKITNRNVIVYYSGWLQKVGLQGQGISFGVDDGDKNGFMTTIHELDRSKGLDLILHTPGGSTSATESLVDYLRQMFGTNIRAFVPQLAMSAGTMIALSCKEIIMGKHSCLGPIDPQIGNLPAHAILEEFEQAKVDVGLNNALAFVWQPILQKYHPTMLGACRKAIQWSTDMTREWLKTGMFLGDPNADTKANQVMADLGSHAITLSHDRHISLKRAKDAGLNVIALEDNQELQDAVLSIHHIFIQTLSETAAYKIIENQNGIAFIQQVQQAIFAVPRV